MPLLPRRRRRTAWRALVPAALLTAGSLYALASGNWCGTWAEQPPAVLSALRGTGALRAGAARVALRPPFPVVRAGYAPPRPDARQSAEPLHARALVLEVGELRVGLVTLDLLTLPQALAARVRERAVAAGLAELVVIATHTHSSFGGYDSRMLSELAGTGRFRAAAFAAAVDAAAAALLEAATGLEDAALEVGELRAPERVYARSGAGPPEGRLLRLALSGGRGPVGELIVFSAHPTLVPRAQATLDPDYPGRLSARREADGAGVCLVVQGAAGDASARQADEGGAEAFAGALAEKIGGAVMERVPVESLGFARVAVALPRPDSARLVPSLVRAAGDNFLCATAPREAHVVALAVGALRFVTAPGEPTAAAGAQLALVAPARSVWGLADGYVGYVESEPQVLAGEGESRRQYFDRGLLGRLARGARVAMEAAAGPAKPLE